MQICPMTSTSNLSHDLPFPFEEFAQHLQSDFFYSRQYKSSLVNQAITTSLLSVNFIYSGNKRLQEVKLLSLEPYSPAWSSRQRMPWSRGSLALGVDLQIDFQGVNLLHTVGVN